MAIRSPRLSRIVMRENGGFELGFNLDLSISEPLPLWIYGTCGLPREERTGRCAPGWGRAQPLHARANQVIEQPKPRSAHGTKRNCLDTNGISGAEGRPAVQPTWRRRPAVTRSS